MTSKAELTLLQVILTTPINPVCKEVCEHLAKRHPTGRFCLQKSRSSTDDEDANDIMFVYQYTEPKQNKPIKLKVHPYGWGNRIGVDIRSYGLVGGSSFKYSAIGGLNLSSFFSNSVDIKLALHKLIDGELIQTERSIMDHISIEVTNLNARKNRAATRKDEKARHQDATKAEVYAHFNITTPSSAIETLYDAVRNLGTKKKIIEAFDKLLPIIK
jgi:hypothetical protein